jgi:hypothetical protein
MTARVAALLLLTVATGCSSKTRAPAFDPTETEKIVVRVPGPGPDPTIADRAEVEAFVGCLVRAERTHSRWSGPATHSLYVHGPSGGRWMLDAETGAFRILTMQAGKPVYRLRAADLETVRRLLAPAPERAP